MKEVLGVLNRVSEQINSTRASILSTSAVLLEAHKALSEAEVIPGENSDDTLRNLKGGSTQTLDSEDPFAAILSNIDGTVCAKKSDTNENKEAVVEKIVADVLRQSPQTTNALIAQTRAHGFKVNGQKLSPQLIRDVVNKMAKDGLITKPDRQFRTPWSLMNKR
jgi:hypothetical protein